MAATSLLRSTTRLIAGTAGLATAAYRGYAAATWLRYGRHCESSDEPCDSLLGALTA